MSTMRLGGKLRRLRQERRLTQAQMAQRLDISPSYLNLLEHNQRPLTAALLLKLARAFDLDVAAFAEDDDQRLIDALTEAFADPVFDGHDLRVTDLQELVAQSPPLATAMLALYRAWRARPEAAADAEADAEEGAPPALGRAADEVADFIQARGNHFRELETAAEALWDEARLSLGALPQGLTAHLAEKLAVDVVIAVDEPEAPIRRYDPRTRRLTLSETLDPAARAFHLALQVALLSHRNLIDRLAGAARLTSAEAEAQARLALANYLAGAVLMPYGPFLAAAVKSRYDIERLMRRFGVSFEQACHRLATLSRPGAKGVPLHFLRVDLAGNVTKRFSGSGIPIARFGGACPRWNVAAAFTTPRRLRVQLSRLPDGSTWLCVARTVGRAGQLGGVERAAVGVGCAVEHARALVYADGLVLTDPAQITPIGVACRVCPRADCADRAEPAPGLLAPIDPDWRGASALAGPPADGR